VIPLKTILPAAAEDAAAPFPLESDDVPERVAPGEERMDTPLEEERVTVFSSPSCAKYDFVPGEVRTATIPFPIVDWGMEVRVRAPVESIRVVDADTDAMVDCVRHNTSAKAADVMRAMFYSNVWMNFTSNA
jgi:hypothetical protein